MAKKQEVGIKEHFKKQHVQPDGLFPAPQDLYAFSPSRVIFIKFLTPDKKKKVRISYFPVHLTHFPMHRFFKQKSWHKRKQG